ncbi:hypothetical protein ABMA67_02525 [Halobacteriovorax sp. RZ-3]|uniref:hypothetical protein n=1 Tax=Halobacteriovorax sp. RZ-3 TaxID=3157720 RepID=UPI003718961B
MANAFMNLFKNTPKTNDEGLEYLPYTRTSSMISYDEDVAMESAMRQFGHGKKLPDEMIETLKKTIEEEKKAKSEKLKAAIR